MGSSAALLQEEKKRVTVEGSSSKTATGNSGDQRNNAAKGVRLTLYIDAVTGTTPTLLQSLESSGL